MGKKLLFIIVGVLLILSAVVYFLSAKKTPPPSPTSQNSLNSTQLSQLPDGWSTYTTPEWKFAINYPMDVKTELTQNGVHFLKLGPTQSTGTELFDGLSLLIYTSQLPSTTFEDFVQKEYKRVKDDPIISSVSPLQDTTVSNFSGKKFEVDGIGKSTTYFLKNGDDGYIKITDMTVEPANEVRDFHKTVVTMLNSLQIVDSPVTSADNAPPGSIHNLPVPEAVQKTKEFASHDFNKPIGEVIVMNAYEREWNNACLGLEEEGEMCAEVITPGYEITIQAGGKERIYRTNSNGSIIKIAK